MERSVLKLLPSATVRVNRAEAVERLRSLCASGLFKFAGVPLRNQVESVTQCVEMLVPGRAPSMPDATGHTFFGQVINRFSCFLRVDAASKVTNQVEGPFIVREGLAKLYSMVSLFDMKKKVDFVSLQPLAMYSWLMTVEQSKHIEQVTTENFGNVPDLPLVPAERFCGKRSGGASGSSGPVGKLRKNNTDLDCARSSSVDALFD